MPLPRINAILDLQPRSRKLRRNPKRLLIINAHPITKTLDRALGYRHSAELHGDDLAEVRVGKHVCVLEVELDDAAFEVRPCFEPVGFVFAAATGRAPEVHDVVCCVFSKGWGGAGHVDGDAEAIVCGAEEGGDGAADTYSVEVLLVNVLVEYVCRIYLTMADNASTLRVELALDLPAGENLLDEGGLGETVHDSLDVENTGIDDTIDGFIPRRDLGKRIQRDIAQDGLGRAAFLAHKLRDSTVIRMVDGNDSVVVAREFLRHSSVQIARGADLRFKNDGRPGLRIEVAS
jgi:hypothetical protein